MNKKCNKLSEKHVNHRTKNTQLILLLSKDETSIVLTNNNLDQNMQINLQKQCGTTITGFRRKVCKLARKGKRTNQQQV